VRLPLEFPFTSSGRNRGDPFGPSALFQGGARRILLCSRNLVGFEIVLLDRLVPRNRLREASTRLNRVRGGSIPLAITRETNALALRHVVNLRFEIDLQHTHASRSIRNTHKIEIFDQFGDTIDW